MDDYSADTSTTGVLLTDGTISTGTLETIGDDDWFEITITAPENYQFHLIGLGSSLLDMQISLYDSFGTLLVSSGGGGTPLSEIIYGFDVGTYYVSATAFGGLGTGAYELTASQYVEEEFTDDPLVIDNPPANDPLMDDFANDATTLGVIELNSQASGVSESNTDSDWFAISVEAGEEYTLTNSNFSEIFLRNADGSLVDGYEATGNPNFGELRTITFTAQATGLLYLDVTATENPEDAFPTIFPDVYTITFTGAPEINGTPIADGEFINTTYDRDATGQSSQFFTVEAEANETIVFTISAESVFRTSLSLVDSNLNTLEFANDDFGGLLSLSYTFEETGEYHIKVFNQSLDLGETFTLSRHDNPQDAGDLSSPETISIGETVTENFIDTNDIDAFSFSAQLGAPLTFYVDGIFGTVDVSFFDALGNDVTGQATLMDFDPLLGTQYEFTALTTGEYSIVLDPADADGFGQRYYQIHLLSSEDMHLGDTSTLSTLAIGDLQSGTINTRADQDWFTLQLDAGEAYTYTLNWDAGLADPDQAPTLNLYDGLGNLVTDFITYSESATDGIATITVPVSTDGTYYIAVSDFNDISTNALDYTLSAELIIDDFGGAPERSGELGSSAEGSVAGQIDYFGDSDWLLSM